MGGGDVLPAEMPDGSSRARVARDAGTTERLLAARLCPDDAPPGYAEVARLLRAAAAPPDSAELAGAAAAMAGAVALGGVGARRRRDLPRWRLRQ